MDKASLKEVFGYMPKAIWWNFVIGSVALLLGIAFGGPKIYIEYSTACVVFIIFLAIYAAIIWWSVLSLAKNKMQENLVTTGPYALVRHPVYSATLFILNPALAIFFRSWLLMLAIVPIYFVWRKYIRLEEKYLNEKFGQEQQEYKRAVWPLIPNLWRINKVAFYSVVSVTVFITAFISLNFPSVYLRWVVFESSDQIAYNEPSQNKLPSTESGQAQATPTPSQSNQSPAVSSGSGSNSSSQNKNVSLPVQQRAVYIDRGDSIIINRLGLNVPLVMTAGASQSQLNDALVKGVIIYPGSALPGQNGEVFLSGHSSIYPWIKTKYGQVFALLDKMEAGDIVSIIYDKYQYNYRITGKEILLPKNTQLIATSQPTLTLMTCWPIGTATKRLVVHGELIQ